jgi:hypothetical protein
MFSFTVCSGSGNDLQRSSLGHFPFVPSEQAISCLPQTATKTASDGNGQGKAMTCWPCQISADISSILNGALFLIFSYTYLYSVRLASHGTCKKLLLLAQMKTNTSFVDCITTQQVLRLNSGELWEEFEWRFGQCLKERSIGLIGVLSRLGGLRETMKRP